MLNNGPETTTILAPSAHTFDIVQVDQYDADNRVVYLRLLDSTLGEQPLLLGVSLWNGQVDHIEYGDGAKMQVLQTWTAPPAN